VSFYVLCLIAVPLLPGKSPFAVQLNNNLLFYVSSAEAMCEKKRSKKNPEVGLYLCMVHIVFESGMYNV
jgi:hypothetical protein